jgi:hypothetical protein
MLFESIDVLNEMICLIRSGPQQSGSSVGIFRDTRDPEVDKLYCSSPFETELAGTFELDTPFVEDEKVYTFTQRDHCVIWQLLQEKNVTSMTETTANVRPTQM